MYPGGRLLQKWGGGEFVSPLRIRVVDQTFPSNRPGKGVSKAGFKIFGAPKKLGWGSKLAQIS